MLGVREASTRISEEVRLQPTRATAYAGRYQDRSRQPRLTTLRTGSSATRPLQIKRYLPPGLHGLEQASTEPEAPLRA